MMAFVENSIKSDFLHICLGANTKLLITDFILFLGKDGDVEKEKEKEKDVFCTLPPWQFQTVPLA